MKSKFWVDNDGNAFITKGDQTWPAKEYNEKFLKEEDLNAQYEQLMQEKATLEAWSNYLDLMQQLKDQFKGLSKIMNWDEEDK